MARYYLDLHECGDVLLDQDGIDVPDVAAARQQAIAAARDVMCGEIGRGLLCLSCFIEIHNRNREVVERIMFSDAITVTGLA